MDKAFAREIWDQKLQRKAEDEEHDPDCFSSMAVLPDVGGPTEEELSLFSDPARMAELSPGELALRAAEHGQVEVLKSLIEDHPLVVHTTDSDGYTPLHRASYGGHVECTSLLLTAGANVNALTAQGWSPLHSACRWSKWRCVALLLQNGVDVNLASDGALTALHLAASTRQVDHDLLSILLMDRRLDGSLENNQGENATTLASRESYYANMFDSIHDCLDVPA